MAMSPDEPTPTTITYLEMIGWEGVAPDVPPDARLVHLPSPTALQYLQLYNGVGAAYQWNDRNVMDREELQSLLDDPRTLIHVLEIHGQAAGYSELDARDPHDIQLAYFGLFDPFVGRGLGRFFLDWTLAYAWSLNPKRVWVHTCDRDHPAALPNYLRAGFRVYAKEVG
jgi:GNAT superfamily N-acetyltransferase